MPKPIPTVLPGFFCSLKKINSLQNCQNITKPPYIVAYKSITTIYRNQYIKTGNYRSQVPIDIRPWTCKKAISRFKLSDIPVAIFGDSTGWSLPDTLYDIVIEGWLKPTHVEVIQNPKFCAVRAGIAEKRVTVAWFPRNFILNLYDASPYSSDRIIAVLRLQAKGIDRDTGEEEPIVGYAVFNIVP